MSSRLSTFFAFLLAFPLALQAGYTSVTEISTTGTRTLSSGLYRIKRGLTLTTEAPNGNDCWNVVSGATAVVYIPKDTTLTLKGGRALDPVDHEKSVSTDGNAFNSRGDNVDAKKAGKRAGAGICVPKGATLILTGEGTLNVSGGKGANGMKGFKPSSNPYEDQHDAHTGGGGKGGTGGGGAAAAIGGVGGTGGAGGAEICCHDEDYTSYKVWEQVTGGNNNHDGNPAGDGTSGTDMGDVYILGTLRVVATGGAGGDSGGAAGAPSNDGCNKTWSNHWFVGPGGGGGGGGAGIGVNYAIGGGAGGGGGGGSGGTGHFAVFDDFYDDGYGSNKNGYVRGDGGEGGESVPSSHNGTKGEVNSYAVDSVTKKSGDIGQSFIAGPKGGARGVHGEYGKNGRLFLAQPTNVVSGSSLPLCETYSAAVDGYEVAQYTITYRVTGDTSFTRQATIGCTYPVVTPPSRVGYEFKGYFSGRNGTGERYYDADGAYCHEDSVYEMCSDLTLYACWKIYGDETRIVVEPGQDITYDGRIDGKAQTLAQPDDLPLVHVKRGGKLTLLNVAICGPSAGGDSAMLNEGTLVVSNCVFRECFSALGWGGVYRDRPGARALFYGCTFKGNSALEGGVIAAEGSEVSVVYSSFLDNATLLEGNGHRAESCSSPYILGQAEGAIAIAVDNAKLNLISCTVVSNLCHAISGCNIAVYNSTNRDDIVLMNNIITREHNSVELSGSTYTWDEPVVNGLNNKGYVDGNNLVCESSGAVLSAEITREVEGVTHVARRPIGAARTGGDSGRLHQGGDFTRFSTAETATTPSFLSADQFGQHPLDGWFGAITGNTLQYLINQTPAGETLVVPAGRYDPVYVDKTIHIVGEDRDHTYINGDLLEPCVVVQPAGAACSWTDFTFYNGNGVNGGGIAAPMSRGAYVTNCVFVSCVATNGGGAAYLSTASQCVFTNCVAAGQGGGSYASALIDRTLLTGCVAGERGGGLAEDVMVRASILSGNAAKTGGGGYGTKFYNCTFDRNVATGGEVSEGAAAHAWLIGCVLYGNTLPTETSPDEYTRNNTRVSAEYKADKFYDAPRDFHLRLRNYDPLLNTRTPVDHSQICLNELDSTTTKLALDENWLDFEGNPLVTIHPMTGSVFYYGGCYAYSPFKSSGLVVNGEEEWYDYTNAKTSLREAIETALIDPAYATNAVAVITFADSLVPKEDEDAVLLKFGEAQIDVAAFTNRTLVIQGPTNRVIAIDGNGAFRAFRVQPGNNLKVENLLFQNCLGSEYGTSPQASAHGGAILNYGTLDVSNCVFLANSTGTRTDYMGVTRPIGYGGAIATMAVTSKEQRATTTIRNTSFVRNRAQRGGALYADKDTRTDVYFTTFGENIAQGAGSTEAAGGAIAADVTSTNALLTLVNCTVVGNSVLEKTNAGGGIVAKAGLTLLDSIVLGNMSGGVTNDLVLSGGSMTQKAGVRAISSAIGARSKKTNVIDYLDDVVYEPQTLGEFISTTNAVPADTTLPHILFPVSTKVREGALNVKILPTADALGYQARAGVASVTTNWFEEARGGIEYEVITNYNYRLTAVRGSTTRLNREGEAFAVDQVGVELSTAIFGATTRVSSPQFPENQQQEEPEEDPEDPEDPLAGAKVVIEDYLGNKTGYKTVEEALDAYHYGDTIQATDAEDWETLDALDAAFWAPMREFVKEHPWFTFTASADLTTYALTLNDEATPIAGEIEVEYNPTEVAMRTLGNVKPDLWYALGYSDSPAGPFQVDVWRQAEMSMGGEPCIDPDKPLTAPKTGTSGFYRVIVAPYVLEEAPVKSGQVGE